MGSAAAPIRLAILEADTPLPATRERFKGYGGVFTHLLTAATATLSPPEALGAALRLSVHDVVGDASSYPALDDVDALLITGSKHSAFGDDEWIVRLVEYARAALGSGRVRVVGVCFGHQIVGRALGAPVARNDKGWEVSVTGVELTGRGRDVFGLDTLKIHQMHRDIVTECPPGVELLARNDVCEVQSMLVPRKLMTVQGHPEFTDAIVREVLEMRHNVGVFPDELYKDGLDRVADEHDGVAVARAFVKFLRE